MDVWRQGCIMLLKPVRNIPIQTTEEVSAGGSPHAPAWRFGVFVELTKCIIVLYAYPNMAVWSYLIVECQHGSIVLIVVQQCSNIIVQQCSTIVLQQYSSIVVQWQSSIVVQQCSSIVVQQYSSIVVQQYSSIVVQLYSCIVVQYRYSSIVALHSLVVSFSLVVQQSSGLVVQQYSSRIVEWLSSRVVDEQYARNIIVVVSSPQCSGTAVVLQKYSSSTIVGSQELSAVRWMQAAGI